MAAQPPGCRCSPLPDMPSSWLGGSRMGRNQSETCAGVFRHSESMSQASQKQGNWVKTHKYANKSPSGACLNLCAPPR